VADLLAVLGTVAFLFLAIALVRAFSHV